MALSKYIITEILQSVPVGDLRLIGHYENEPVANRHQVIVRRGKKKTDLSMKKGSSNELEILLPPLTFEVFAALMNNSPTECLFDKELSASEFQISVIYGNGTRTVTTAFSII